MVRIGGYWGHNTVKKSWGLARHEEKHQVIITYLNGDHPTGEGKGAGSARW